VAGSFYLILVRSLKSRAFWRALLVMSYSRSRDPRPATTGCILEDLDRHRKAMEILMTCRMLLVKYRYSLSQREDSSHRPICRIVGDDCSSCSCLGVAWRWCESSPNVSLHYHLRLSLRGLAYVVQHIVLVQDCS
jgi:hypothetical protein